MYRFVVRFAAYLANIVIPVLVRVKVRVEVANVFWFEPRATLRPRS